MVRKPRPRDLIMAANKKIKRLNKVGEIRLPLAVSEHHLKNVQSQSHFVMEVDLKERRLRDSAAERKVAELDSKNAQ